MDHSSSKKFPASPSPSSSLSKSSSRPTSKPSASIADIRDLLDQIEHRSDLRRCDTIVKTLCAFMHGYNLALTEIVDVYSAAFSMLSAPKNKFRDCGYDLLYGLLNTQELPVQLRSLVLRDTLTLPGPIHKLQRPRLLQALTSGGKDIDGLEHVIADSLTITTKDCHDLKIENDLESAEAGAYEVPMFDGLALQSRLFHDAFRMSLQLISDTVKFGPSLSTNDVKALITDLRRYVWPPFDKDVNLHVLRVFDALVTRGELPREVFSLATRLLASIHGQSSRLGRSACIEKTQQTFRWLMNTYAKDMILDALVSIVDADDMTQDEQLQEVNGALQLFSVTLKDPILEAHAKLDLDRVLSSFQRTHLSQEFLKISNELSLLTLLVERENLHRRLLSEADWENLCLTLLLMSARVDSLDEINRIERRALFDDLLCRIDIISSLDPSQREALKQLYLKLGQQLPSSLAEKLLRTYGRPLDDAGCCHEMKQIKTGFLDASAVSSNLRFLALEVLQSVCLAAQQRDSMEGRICIDLMLEVLGRPDLDLTIQSKLVECVLQYQAQLAQSDRDYFLEMIAKMATSIRSSANNTDDTTMPHGRTRNVSKRHIASGLVVLFMRNINHDNDLSLLLYTTFFDLLQDSSVDPASKVMLFRGLFRMRSDVNYHLFLVSSPEGEGLAATLHRSKATFHIDSRRASRISHLSDNGPVWMYGEIRGLPTDPPLAVSPILYTCVQSTGSEDDHLDMAAWLRLVISLLQDGADWEVYSYIIVHLGAQLSNQSLFVEAEAEIRELRSTVCQTLLKQTFRKPPEGTEIKQSDVAVCLYHILTMLIGYHEHFSRAETEEMISAFIFGMTAWDRTTNHCVHALTLCCYELPDSLRRDLVRIVSQMATIVTKSDAANHVLEFLAGLCRLSDLARTFHGEEIKTVFGVCFSYIEYVRGMRFDEMQQKSRTFATARASNAGVDSLRSSSDDISEYVFALAYHVITFWFITLRQSDREKYFPWMQQRLLSIDQAGEQEEQGLVTFDLVWRVSQKKSTTAMLSPPPAASQNALTYISDYSHITLDPSMDECVLKVTERRPSGTDIWTTEIQDAQNSEAIYNHYQASIPKQMFPCDSEPTMLQNNDALQRALGVFDRVSPVDFFKSGVIYIGEGQKDESEIFANLMGSKDYRLMLQGLGERLALEGLNHSSEGLDRSEAHMDGTYTIWHRDDVTALIYHISTMMPTDLKTDPQCINKKRHIGNDYVNIVFNNSGTALDFATLNDTFPSQFNFVYIVIAPEARATFIETRTRQHLEGWFDKSWFKVQVLTRQDFPNISPAAETKVVSGKVLAKFVRNLALNACVFAHVWRNRDGREYPSSWKQRLHQLRQLKERFGKKDVEVNGGH